jgi:ATP-dependent RNA/DNA helicase IGHMBP2
VDRHGHGQQRSRLLDAEREEARSLAGRALVLGPPGTGNGTGKTTMLVELIRRAVARGEQALACAPPNLADELLRRARRAA